MMALGYILYAVGGLGSLVCFILVLVRMFQAGRGGLGLTCILLSLCCGIGSFVAFIVGWARHREWGLTNVMTAWTVCYVMLVAGYAFYPVSPDQLREIPLP